MMIFDLTNKWIKACSDAVNFLQTTDADSTSAKVAKVGTTILATLAVALGAAYATYYTAINHAMPLATSAYAFAKPYLASLATKFPTSLTGAV